MIETKRKIRKWGRSFGIVIPKKIINKEKMKEGEEVEVFIKKKNHPLKGTFGTLKFKESSDKILEEIDKEGWDE